MWNTLKNTVRYVIFTIPVTLFPALLIAVLLFVPIMIITVIQMALEKKWVNYDYEGLMSLTEDLYSAGVWEQADE